MTTDKKPSPIDPPIDEQVTKILELEEQLLLAEQAKLRALADLENFRRRESESRANWSRAAVSDWVRTFLPSLQELLLGAEHTKDADIQKVILKFMGKLEEQGLSKIIPAPGEEINPDEHIVLLAAEGAPGTVVQVFEPGWKLGESILLPAKISGAPLS
jgi:molecular chaperone GrpE (heat shock protein)